MEGAEQLSATRKQKTEYVHALAEQQKNQFSMTLDHHVSEQEMILLQEYNEQLRQLQQLAHVRRAELEHQAAAQELEWRQRKVQQEFVRQNVSMEEECAQAQSKITEKIEELGWKPRAPVSPPVSSLVSPLGSFVPLPLHLLGDRGSSPTSFPKVMPPTKVGTNMPCLLQAPTPPMPPSSLSLTLGASSPSRPSAVYRAPSPVRQSSANLFAQTPPVSLPYVPPPQGSRAPTPMGSHVVPTSLTLNSPPTSHVPRVISATTSRPSSPVPLVRMASASQLGSPVLPCRLGSFVSPATGAMMGRATSYAAPVPLPPKTRLAPHNDSMTTTCPSGSYVAPVALSSPSGSYVASVVMQPASRISSHITQVATTSPSGSYVAPVALTSPSSSYVTPVVMQPAGRTGGTGARSPGVRGPSFLSDVPTLPPIYLPPIVLDMPPAVLPPARMEVQQQDYLSRLEPLLAPSLSVRI